MKVFGTSLPGVLGIEPDVFGDERGWFMENWRDERYRDHGIELSAAQLNSSASRRGVVRGLHFQWPEPQGKLVWVQHGAVFDVAVDLRSDSPHFGRWTALELSQANRLQLWIPPGFGHGFQVVSEHAVFSYLCTRAYRPEYDKAVAWDDPEIGVGWPLPPAGLSAKDRAAPCLSQLSEEQLPTCESC